jgi:hypothetical protein
MKRVEEEEDVVDSETGEEYKRTIEKYVDAEVEDKVLMVPARNDNLPYSVYVLN